MTKAQHTPGPWIIDQTGDFFVINTIDDTPICDLYTHSDNAQEANARLIAAAPKLLKALEDLSAFYRKSFIGTTNKDVQMLQNAENVIAEAKGQL